MIILIPENLIPEVGDNVSTVGEAKSEIIMGANHCSYSARGRLQKRLETHMGSSKASILQAEDTTAAEFDRHESNSYHSSGHHEE